MLGGITTSGREEGREQINPYEGSRWPLRGSWVSLQSWPELEGGAGDSLVPHIALLLDGLFPGKSCDLEQGRPSSVLWRPSPKEADR